MDHHDSSDSDPHASEPELRARALAQALYGEGIWDDSPRTSHICAAVRRPNGRLHVLDIGSHEVPRSEHDFFALNLTRARADALLTSSANLRSEPFLSHHLQGTHAQELAALRLALGKAEKPVVAILTASGNIPRDHGAFRDGTPKVILTTPQGAATLLHFPAELARVVVLPALSPSAALAWLKQRHAHISLEAGPRTTSALYEQDASAIDELLLSLFEGPLETQDSVGNALPEDAVLFGEKSLKHRSVREEPSGRWVFERWAR